ncbi:MAG: hypothetical protein NTV24_03895 [Candidatus Woesebacteria bacterium]|nr:hypothetical protein [Candidatus Woesebacteria bacterium]
MTKFRTDTYMPSGFSFFSKDGNSECKYSGIPISEKYSFTGIGILPLSKTNFGKAAYPLHDISHSKIRFPLFSSNSTSIDCSYLSYKSCNGFGKAGNINHKAGNIKRNMAFLKANKGFLKPEISLGSRKMIFGKARFDSRLMEYWFPQAEARFRNGKGILACATRVFVRTKLLPALRKMNFNQRKTTEVKAFPTLL